MQVRKGFGGCFWIFMFIMVGVGLVTFPYGIAIWAIQIYIIVQILRTPSDD